MSIRLRQQRALVERVKSTSSYEALSCVPSPCVKICTIIDNHCTGCGRTADEIREWFYCNDTRKKEILKRISDG